MIPLYIPQCGDCKFCKSPKTNVCSKIRVTQGKGVMPDNTSRFTCKGQTIAHFMGCSTFSEYTVVADISLTKVFSVYKNIIKVLMYIHVYNTYVHIYNIHYCLVICTFIHF